MLQGCSSAWVRTGASGGGAQSGGWNHLALGPPVMGKPRAIHTNTAGRRASIETTLPTTPYPTHHYFATAATATTQPPASTGPSWPTPMHGLHGGTWWPHASVRYLLARGTRPSRRTCYTCGCRAQRHTRGCGVSLQGSGRGGCHGWQGGAAAHPSFAAGVVAATWPPAPCRRCGRGV